MEATLTEVGMRGRKLPRARFTQVAEISEPNCYNRYFWQKRYAARYTKKGIQATMLTRSGPYLIAAPPQDVVNAGGALMLELIRRAQEEKAVSEAANAACDPVA